MQRSNKKYGKYFPFQEYLTQCGQDKVTLSFEVMASILGVDRLPESIYVYQGIWESKGHYPFSRGWVEAGYNISANLREQRAVFTKSAQTTTAGIIKASRRKYMPMLSAELAVDSISAIPRAV